MAGAISNDKGESHRVLMFAELATSTSMDKILQVVRIENKDYTGTPERLCKEQGQAGTNNPQKEWPA
jgi:hypothetical protein